MKKLWVKILLVLVALVILAVVLGFLFLDSIVKRSVETVGPAIAKVEVKLAGAHISPFSGSGELKGLVVGNPPEYKTTEAIKVGEVGISVVPKSVMGDKVIVRSVKVLGPEITFEGSLTGGNNLSKILENVQGTEAKPQPQTKEETKAKTRKLQVDDFLISGGKVHVHVSATLLGGKSATVPLPEIHFTNLGQGPEGITPAELVSRVLKEVTEATLKAVAASIGKEMTEGVKNLGTGTVDQVGKSVKGIGDLLKKKPAPTNETK
jgi:hypothetical protein